jgi:K+-sensing histidine kinase KdpD
MNSLVQKNSYYRLIQSLTVVLTAQSPHAMLQQFAYHTANLINAAGSLVYLQDDPARPPKMKIVWTKEKGFSTPVDISVNPLAELVIKEKRSLKLDPPDHCWVLTTEQVHFPEVNRITAIPLLTSKKAIGMVELINHPNPISPDEEELLLILAAQTAKYYHKPFDVIQPEKSADSVPEFIEHIRSPLTTMNTIAYLLKQPELPEEQRFELVNSFQLQANQINNVVNSFEEVTDWETGRISLEPVLTDIVPILHKSIHQLENLATRHMISITEEIPETLPAIEIDGKRMEQVFTHIIQNAIQYNHPKGSVYISAWEESGNLWVCIQDSGNGIPETDIPAVFDKFYRAHNAEKVKAGPGLGLALCKQIIQAHKGQIDLKSKLSVGTIITIQLPLKI